MNCHEFWKTMPELAIKPDQSLHLRVCPACARLWEQQCVLNAGLRAVAAEWSHVGAPARVEARLTTAFREHSGLGRSRPGMPGPRMWLPVVTWFAATAAVVLVALALLNNRPQPVHGNLPSGFQSAMVASVDPEAVDAYNAEDFIPLPNAPQISPDEDVNLVRVELQRSAMIPLGYDVSADRASEPVEAEVVLGADGVARAVRFLDE